MGASRDRLANRIDRKQTGRCADNTRTNGRQRRALGSEGSERRNMEIPCLASRPDSQDCKLAEQNTCLESVGWLWRRLVMLL